MSDCSMLTKQLNAAIFSGIAPSVCSSCARTNMDWRLCAAGGCKLLQVAAP